MAEESGADVRATVLICEDEPAILNLTREILLAAGYQVITADDGNRALEVSADYEGSIELLLVDIVLPGINGPELAERLRADRPALKVVFTSGYGAAAGVALKQRDESAIFLPKPFTPKQLTETVGEVLAGTSA